MLLAIDIGNTAIKFGLFDGDKLAECIVIGTKRDVSHEGLARMVSDRLEYVSDAIVSSVVPETDSAVRSFLTALTGRKPRFVRTTDDLGLRFNFPVEGVGTDRLINSFAAAEIHGTPCIVIAFGTATTIDVVNKDREHLGGLIAPGPKASARALADMTSKLPEVEIAEPSNVINTTTAGAIQAGIFYSQVGLIETAIPHIKAEIGERAKVVTTGGFAPLIADKCSVIDVVEADLTLRGLKMLYSRA